MLQEIIPSRTKNSLETLVRAGLLGGFYLAGGTGLALQLKHRLSLDLDFFTGKDIDVKALIKKLGKLGELSVEKEAKQTLVCEFKKTRLSFFKYEYPRLFKVKKLYDIAVADPKDIGCMKISAISSRGTKKDFIDLYFICQKVLPLDRLLKLFEKKYESVDYNMMHIKKSLVYFTDAERDPLPKMLSSVAWKEVKSSFQREVKKLI